MKKIFLFLTISIATLLSGCGDYDKKENIPYENKKPQDEIVLNKEYVKNRIKNIILAQEKENNIQDVEIVFQNHEEKLFAAILIEEKDWAEKFKVGRFENGAVIWLDMEEPPDARQLLAQDLMALMIQ